MNKSEKTKFGAIKSALSKNNKFTAGISFLFLFLIMFSLFAFIITGLYRFGLIELPAFIQNLFFKTDDDEPEAEKDDKNIYDYLVQNEPENYESAGEGFVLEISLDNVRDAIAGTKLPDNLHLETEAYYYTDGKISKTEEMALWKKGEKYKYLLRVNSVPEESYINDSKNESIENFVTESQLKRAATASFSFENIPHMPNINHYLDLLEGGQITDYHITQNSDFENIVEIRYSLPQIDQWELIYISLDTGIVLEVRSYFGAHNDPYYRCVTNVNAAYYNGDTQAEAQAQIDDELFMID